MSYLFNILLVEKKLYNAWFVALPLGSSSGPLKGPLLVVIELEVELERLFGGCHFFFFWFLFKKVRSKLKTLHQDVNLSLFFFEALM